jgi:gamma-glutamylcyclotransferase (GGCT)/AIG2-like uncharacterized protein YtfP
MPAVRLFVYGSLRRGQPNHHQLRGAKFVAVARTLAEHALAELDGYPLLVPGSVPVAGELFELEIGALTRLDAFEGENYVRGEVRLEDGGRALAYVASPSALERV